MNGGMERTGGSDNNALNSDARGNQSATYFIVFLPVSSRAVKGGMKMGALWRARPRVSVRLFVFFEIFFGNVILRNFAGMDLACLIVVGFFHALDDAGFKGVTFFEQFIDAFRVGAFHVA